MSIEVNALATTVRPQEIRVPLASLLAWPSKQQGVWTDTPRVMSPCFRAQPCQSRGFGWSLWSVNKICLRKRKETWSRRVGLLAYAERFRILGIHFRSAPRWSVYMRNSKFNPIAPPIAQNWSYSDLFVCWRSWRSFSYAGTTSCKPSLQNTTSSATSLDSFGNRWRGSLLSCHCI